MVGCVPALSPTWEILRCGTWGHKGDVRGPPIWPGICPPQTEILEYPSDQCLYRRSVQLLEGCRERWKNHVNFVCCVATFNCFSIHQVLEDFIFVPFNHISDSAVSHSEYAPSIASGCVGEGTRYAEVLQVANLLLNDINATANVT